mgnify:CR=1 FL=1
MQRAQVVKLDRGYPLVRCEDGRLVRCEHATALVKGEKVRAVIGDFVEVNAPEGHDKGIIESICPRERAFVRNGHVLHHILDPRTGKPAETDVLSATVIADKSLDADGYTTALIVMGADEALTFAEQTPGIEAILLTTNAHLLKTTGMQGEDVQLQAG